jgi:hypothetical protein
MDGGKASDEALEGTASTTKTPYSSMAEYKDLYKIIVDTRNLEITLFWQRSNYFLVLNSVLAVGFFNSKITEPVYLIGLAFFGAIASALWLRVTLGSKYWQARWEERLSIFEKEVADGIDFFSADWKTLDEDVKQSLQRKNKHENAKLKSRLEALVLKKNSVSYNMMLLSILFMIAWLLLAAATMAKVIWP